MKRRILTIVLLSWQILSLYSQEPILVNGTYFVNFKDKLILDYKLSIDDTLVIQYFENDTVVSTAEWWDNNLLVFQNTEQSKADQGRLETMMKSSFGPNCLEIFSERLSNRRFKFRTTYVGQLHITCNEGNIKRFRN